MTVQLPFPLCALAAALLLTLPLPASAQESQPPTVDQLRQDTQALIDKLGDYSAEQRDKALEAASESLARLDERIARLREELQENWDAMSRESRETTREQLEALEKQRAQVADWYDRLRSSSASAWLEIGPFSVTTI